MTSGIVELIIEPFFIFFLSLEDSFCKWREELFDDDEESTRIRQQEAKASRAWHQLPHSD